MPKRKVVKLCDQHRIPKAWCERCKGLRFRPVKERETKKTFKQKLGKAIRSVK